MLCISYNIFLCTSENYCVFSQNGIKLIKQFILIDFYKKVHCKFTRLFCIIRIPECMLYLVYLLKIKAKHCSSGSSNEKKKKKQKLLCSPMDCSSPGSSIHGIFQPRILERLVIPFSRESS